MLLLLSVLTLQAIFNSLPQVNISHLVSQLSSLLRLNNLSTVIKLDRPTDSRECQCVTLVLSGTVRSIDHGQLSYNTGLFIG